MSINIIGSDIPIQVDRFGGTGNSTLAANGVLYGNGTAPIGVTTTGTSGQVLTSNGAGLAPSYQTLPAIGSGFEYVTTLAVPGNGGSTVLSTGYAADYNTYLFVLNSLSWSSYSVTGSLTIQISINGGSSWINAQANFNPVFVFGYRTRDSTWFQEGYAIGGFLICPIATNYASSATWIYGINKLAIPSSITLWGGGGSAGLGAVPGYTYQTYTGSALTVNRLRLVNFGITVTSGTVNVYRIQS